MKVIFLSFSTLSIQELIRILQGGTFKIVDFNNALIVARFLVEIDKPITDIH